jgi:hypothetical protein
MKKTSSLEFPLFQISCSKEIYKTKIYLLFIQKELLSLLSESEIQSGAIVS